MSEARLYAYLLEFASVQDLLAGARMVSGAGYRRVEAFTPFPVAELDHILPRPDNHVALCVLLGGIAGALLGYGIQYYAAVIDYPYLAGGKPMHSWPAFIPVTFELTVLCAALAGFLAVIWGSGLPRLHHPVFEAPQFRRASRDRFFLLVEAADPRFDARRTVEELEALGALSLTALREGGEQE